MHWDDVDSDGGASSCDGSEAPYNATVSPLRFSVEVSGHLSNSGAACVITFERLRGGWRGRTTDYEWKDIANFDYPLVSRRHRRRRPPTTSPEGLVDAWLRPEWARCTIGSVQYGYADGTVVDVAASP